MSDFSYCHNIITILKSPYHCQPRKASNPSDDKLNIICYLVSLLLNNSHGNVWVSLLDVRYWDGKINRIKIIVSLNVSHLRLMLLNMHIKLLLLHTINHYLKPICLLQLYCNVWLVTPILSLAVTVGLIIKHNCILSYHIHSSTQSCSGVDCQIIILSYNICFKKKPVTHITDLSSSKYKIFLSSHAFNWSACYRYICKNSSTGLIRVIW
jgi:hypothetical protein